MARRLLSTRATWRLDYANSLRIDPCDYNPLFDGSYLGLTRRRGGGNKSLPPAAHYPHDPALLFCLPTKQISRWLRITDPYTARQPRITLIDFTIRPNQLPVTRPLQIYAQNVYRSSHSLNEFQLSSALSCV